MCLNAWRHAIVLAGLASINQPAWLIDHYISYTFKDHCLLLIDMKMYVQLDVRAA
jgi:hypothetical protein